MNRAVVFSVVSFILGVVLAGVVVVNPAGWGWLSDLTADLRSESAMARAGQGAPPQPLGDPAVQYWKSPMDPTFISDNPGKDPMGMDLVPVYEGETESAPAGTVLIDPGFVQNIGVRSEVVQRTDIPFTIRTVGVLTYNDRDMAWVNTKYVGWIEDVAVNYVGEAVSQGQRLFDVYSPQLVTTQKEYLQAVDYVERLGATKYPEIAVRARSLLASARERLEFWDITDEQIDELEESGQVRRTLSVTSPIDGIVVEKMDQALEGMYVNPGMNLYKIADLSTIWVEVEVFENQVPWLKVGQWARVELPYSPGRVYNGRVRYLYPFFTEQTRTMKVSIELQNPDQTLRAEMYANVTFEVPSATNVLAVPEEAVIRSGTRDVLVLDRGMGRFDVREVTLGVNGSGLWEVTDGIVEGDRIVVSAQFLIDSESSLREAIRKITSPGSDVSPATGPGEEAAPVVAPSPQH